MLTMDAYAEGRAAGLEEAAQLLHARARNLVCDKKRTNQIDRWTSEVLARARDDVLALKVSKPQMLAK
jgi:hypothetical protein